MSQHSPEEQFSTAVTIVQNLPKDGPITTSNDEKLMFYGLFKQATEGDCNIGRPSIFSIVERYKWDAWKKNDGMSKTDAMEKYLEGLLEKIDEVERNYDIKQWLAGDLFDFMMPKFAIIGKQYDQKSKSEEERSQTPAEVISDTEYCDAMENEEEISRSTSSYEMQESPRSRKRSDFRITFARIEEQLKVISEQVDRLTRATEQRHSFLLDLFRKSRLYLFVPNRVGWIRFVIFLLLWPVIAHNVFKFLLRRVSEYYLG